MEKQIALNRLKIARKGNKRAKAGAGGSFLNTRILKEGFTRLDAFGRPVTLTFKGKESYQTLWGAWVSVVMYSLFGLLILALWQDYRE